MPELPEVETVKNRLEEVLVGRQIKQVKVLRDKSFRGSTDQLLGAEIETLERRAKLIKIQLSNGLYLLIHLKMTGQLIFVDDQHRVGGGHPTADWVHQLPGDHTRVIVDFANGSQLFFNDMRVFGWIKVLDESGVEQELSKYGPDVVDSGFTADYLQEQLKNRTIPIKQAIMIGQIVGGVGNIYASEALFTAGIDPRRPANGLSSKEYQRLTEALKQVISEGIEYGGTTFDGSYVNVDGLAGDYQDELKVYGQEQESCPQCSGKINKIKIANRGTYFCPQCQD